MKVKKKHVCLTRNYQRFMAGKRRSTIMLKMEECDIEEIITTIYVFSTPKVIFQCGHSPTNSRVQFYTKVFLSGAVNRHE